MQLHSPTRATLTGALLPRSGVIADVLLVAAGSLLIAILAQLAVPIGPVPVSGQTLGVLLVAATLGTRRGVWAVLLYLAEGAAGLPVFAGGRAGVVVLAGPTGGYLAGFVAAALVVGWLCERGLDRHPFSAFAAMAAGSAAIYAFGMIWLSRFTGWPAVMEVGVLPFLAGDLIKAIIAAVALPGAWQLVQRTRSPEKDGR